MSMTLDQLEVLDAIDRNGSFARAARELGRATSAVSYAISSLESALEIPLFDRSGHRASLTAAGRRILDEGRRLLFQARRLERLALELRDEWEPRLSIVVEGILPMPPILRALRRFRERGVPTRVTLHIEHLGGVRERFEREHADLMLVIDYSGDARHTARPLPAIEMLLLCHREHPLHNFGRVDRTQLAEHVELCVDDSARDREPRTGRLSLGSPQVFRLSDFHTKREALLAGVGFGWMPRHLVEDVLARGELLPLEFVEGERYVFEPQLVQRRADLGRAAQLFEELLEAEIGGSASCSLVSD